MRQALSLVCPSLSHHTSARFLSSEASLLGRGWREFSAASRLSAWLSLLCQRPGAFRLGPSLTLTPHMLSSQDTDPRESRPLHCSLKSLFGSTWTEGLFENTPPSSTTEETDRQTGTRQPRTRGVHPPKTALFWETGSLQNEDVSLT